jgi:hypothetical protein
MTSERNFAGAKAWKTAAAALKELIDDIGAAKKATLAAYPTGDGAAATAELYDRATCEQSQAVPFRAIRKRVAGGDSHRRSFLSCASSSVGRGHRLQCDVTAFLTLTHRVRSTFPKIARKPSACPLAPSTVSSLCALERRGTVGSLQQCTSGGPRRYISASPQQVSGGSRSTGWRCSLGFSRTACSGSSVRR